MFNLHLFLCVLATWIICFFCIIKGVRSSSWVVMITVPLPFIMLAILIGYYVSLNNSVSGKGIEFYLGGENFG